MARWALLGAMIGGTVFGLLLAWAMVHIAYGWEEERDEHVRSTR